MMTIAEYYELQTKVVEMERAIKAILDALEVDVAYVVDHGKTVLLDRE